MIWLAAIILMLLVVYHIEVRDEISYERRIDRRVRRGLTVTTLELGKTFAPPLMLYFDILRTVPWVLRLGVWAGVVLACCLLLIGILAPFVTRFDRYASFQIRWFCVCAAAYAVIRHFAGPITGPATAQAYAFVLFARGSFQTLGWLR